MTVESRKGEEKGLMFCFPWFACNFFVFVCRCSVMFVGFCTVRFVLCVSVVLDGDELLQIGLLIYFCFRRCLIEIICSAEKYILHI